jgi:hypothetical protein
VVVTALLVPGRRMARGLVVLALAGTIAGLSGTTAYAVTTAGSAHTGSIPSVGPAGASSSFGGAGGFGGGGPGGGTRPGGAPGSAASGTGGPAGTAFGTTGTSAGDQAPAGGGFGGGGFGGESTSTSAELTALLQKAGTRWAAATVGSGTAASLQLASAEPVMSIGGFNGGDPAPTLAAFKEYVADGDVRYFVSGGDGGGGGGRGNSEIATWVAATYTATTVGGQTVYDLQAS